MIKFTPLLFISLFFQYCNAQICVIDSTFNDDGRAITTVTASGDVITALIPLPGNQVIAVGYVSNGALYDVGMVKYLEDGSLDPDFGVDGIMMDGPDFAGLIPNDAILIDSEHILVGGSWFEDGTKDIFLARYDLNGNRDVTFGVDGYVRYDLGTGAEEIYTLAQQEDGKIVAGMLDVDDSEFICLVARFNADGSIDNSFGVDGFQNISVTESDDFVNSILVQTDGKIVGAGYGLNVTTNYNFIVFRLTSNGLPDSSFNSNGKLEFDFENTSDVSVTLTMQDDGKLLVGGSSEDGAAVLRLTENGIPDSSFADDGAFLLTNAGCAGILVDDLGQIIGGGKITTAFDQADFGLFRILQNGNLDSTFGEDGVIATDFGNSSEASHYLAFAADGKILSGGYTNFNQDFAVTRYTYEEIIGIQQTNVITSPLHVFPNPVNDIFYCDVPFTVDNTTYYYSIVNDMGQQITAGKAEINDLNSILKITIPENTAAGNYYLKLQNNITVYYAAIYKL
jgi:uncharacterized delta-60 repeat protein